ncbi:MAG: hypothetical protein ABI882_07545 [Acidobacteriota bacterium]
MISALLETPHRQRIEILDEQSAGKKYWMRPGRVIGYFVLPDRSGQPLES